ncbi:sugar symporter [Halarchaeum acidiphilum MH1-52-1]|uniref:Sugar symporter n=1 Tax=Halarchaeum acidiphilum MH1-52-1 TaxID=1261545 RepID=U3A6L4_9EURY|nr:sugar porter family MFS transporter [Halarchaeum acidiphilum]GAD53299.1 sugar symporter [Halarchaeum acidiphilum MH1-52-1]
MNAFDRLLDAEHEHKRFVYVMAIIAALNGLLFGFDTGVISGALPYIQQSFHLSTFHEEIVTASVLIGAMVGGSTGGRLADRLGRRRLALGAAVVFFVASIGLALSPSVSWLIAWRIVEGVGVGVASILGTLYISETAPPDIRGSLGFLQQFMIVTGILVAYVVNYAFAPSFLGVIGWRWMLGFGAVPAAILGTGMFFLPETPRWLVENGHLDEARAVLSRIHTREETEQEIDAIREASQQESNGDLSELLSPWIRPALTVGIALAVLQQVTGINTVLYYAPTILQSIGLGSIASLFGTIGIGVVNVVFTAVAVMYVDRIGRRKLLLIGSAGMTVMLAVLGLGFYLPGLSGSVGYLTLGSMILYVAFFAIGLGPVFWLLISEIYPLHVRGTAEGISSFFNWAANFAVSLTFLSLMQQIGRSISFWILGVFGLITFLFTYYRVPETMGRSIEEIEADLRESAIIGSDRGTSTTTDDT